MKVSCATVSLASAIACLPLATAGPVVERRAPDLDLLNTRFASEIARRSIPDAPNGYTPTAVDCPATRPSIRNASTISQNETEWLQTRRKVTIPAMRTLFQQLNITGLDTNSYFDNNSQNMSMLPNIGIAASGGGYRALLNGAGALAAFDARTTHNSTAAASLAGLLQSATYLAGLSGGSWLVGSLYTNNFTSVQSILDSTTNETSGTSSGSLWQFGNSIFEGPDAGSIQLLDSIDYYTTIAKAVGAKADAGFNTTITDYWGRALSYQLVNATNGGPAYTFSSIAEAEWFTDASAPMPIIVSDGRRPGTLLVDGNSTVYEFNPWELGTFDPTTYGFTPLRYLGTNFTAGSITANDKCIRGFDNSGFVMGTSSTLFNQFLLQINSTTNIPDILQSALEDVLTDVGRADDDISDIPNPFYLFSNGTSYIANDRTLTLVDGGEDLQNIPLHPLIQPDRHVDVIFAIDSSADTVAPASPGWPNGTSLVATYERQFLPIGNGTVFPSVPDQQTFVNLGLNNRPSFFGCDASNLTGPSPLIVYLPNSPYSYNSNVSTFDPTYNDTERNAMINNGYDVVTMGNGTIDAQWPTCVGCAILSRSLNRTNTPVPEVCTACFQRYCWDGTRNETPHDYTPSMRLEAIKVTSSASVVERGSMFAIVAALTAGVVLL